MSLPFSISIRSIPKCWITTFHYTYLMFNPWRKDRSKGIVGPSHQIDFIRRNNRAEMRSSTNVSAKTLETEKRGKPGKGITESVPSTHSASTRTSVKRSKSGRNWDAQLAGGKPPLKFHIVPFGSSCIDPLISWPINQIVPAFAWKLNNPSFVNNISSHFHIQRYITLQI